MFSQPLSPRDLQVRGNCALTVVHKPSEGGDQLGDSVESLIVEHLHGGKWYSTPLNDRTRGSPWFLELFVISA